MAAVYFVGINALDALLAFSLVSTGMAFEAMPVMQEVLRYGLPFAVASKVIFAYTLILAMYHIPKDGWGFGKLGHLTGQRTLKALNVVVTGICVYQAVILIVGGIL